MIEIEIRMFKSFNSLPFIWHETSFHINCIVVVECLKNESSTQKMHP